MKVRLGIGVGTEPSIHWALAADLGDCIQHRMTESKDEMKSLYDIIMNSGKSFACGEWTPRAKEIPTMEEMTSRCAFASEEFQEIIKRAGNKYLGRQILGEFGGNVFWPYRYLKQPISEGGGGYGLLPEADSMLSAAQNFIVKAREHIKLEQAYGCGPFFVTDSGMLFKYLLEAAEGMIELCPSLEMMPGNPEMLFSAIRGTVRAYGRETFGTLIAFGWYGGAKWDELYFKRWEVALKYAYLSGSNYIHSESGHFGGHHYHHNHAIHSAEARRFRKILRNFAEFCEEDERPDSGPVVNFGVLSGNLDGFHGTSFSTTVWGQYESGTQWNYGDAEKTWGLLNRINTGMPWHCNCNQGNVDTSGHPAYGQYDVVPVESSVETLSRYSCLVFMGWNTMTPEIYENLCQYVRNGGRLLAALPHCGVNIHRDAPLQLYNEGDLRALFGVKIVGASATSVHGVKFRNHEDFAELELPDWSERSDIKFPSNGFKLGNITVNETETLIYSAELFDSNRDACLPVLTGFRNGKGKAFLLNALEYPGSDNLIDLWHFLLLSFMKVQPLSEDWRIMAQRSIRYAVYEAVGGARTVYLLNTDFEFSACCRITIGGQTTKYMLAPCELCRVELDDFSVKKV